MLIITKYILYIFIYILRNGGKHLSNFQPRYGGGGQVFSKESKVVRINSPSIRPIVIVSYLTSPSSYNSFIPNFTLKL